MTRALGLTFAYACAIFMIVDPTPEEHPRLTTLVVLLGAAGVFLAALP